jgi:hypothetical protein
MKTITITINISEEVQKPLTIKSSIQEQINFHLKEREKANILTAQIKEKSREVLNEMLLKLNKSLGENVWFQMQNLLEIKFQSSCIRAEFEQERVQFGNIVYYKSNLESLKFLLIHCNSSMYRPSVTEFKSLEEVNSILEKDYINYFTNGTK